MKERLYYINPYTKSFSTSVVDRSHDEEGQFYVVLKETAFYPTGGGQPCDLGTIHGIEVINVEEIDGEIRHTLKKELPNDQKEVEGIIDWNRRFDHMQQHLGQHILSASFDDLYVAKTIGFHLGRDTVSIDLNISELTPEMVDNVEKRANEIVMDNRMIDVRFVNEDELSTLPLRKRPTVTENIRLVIVPYFDYNPCGGIHPAYTAEVGMIKILHWERYKNSVRVEFVCGTRAWKALSVKHTVLRNVGQQLASSESEIPDNVNRLLLLQKETERSLHEAKTKLLEYEANELIAQAEMKDNLSIITGIFKDRTIQELQKLTQLINSQQSSSVVFLITSGEKTQMVFGRGAGVSAEMSSLMKQTLTLIDGKGGGSTHLAQGGGNSTRTPEELMEYARELLHSQQNRVIN